MSTVPPPYRLLVDDAAIFPPGNLSLSEAVAAHRRHRAAPYAAMIGPFLVSDAALPQLGELVRDEPGEPLAVSVVVAGGAGALDGAVRWTVSNDGLDLRGLEIALRDSLTGEVSRNARRIVTALDQLVAAGQLDDDLPVYVEPPQLFGDPPTPDWLGALDEIAAAGLRLKYRTGGEAPQAFPAPHELAASIEAALDRETAYKCTAGLHHAVRTLDPESGFDQHGFLNLLLATRTALDGGSVDDLAEVLAERDADTVRDAATGDDRLETARRWFSSFGSCSVLEPVEDLISLGILPEMTSGAA